MVTSVTVKDSAGADQTVNTLPALGTAADAASLPVAWSTEGKAAIGALTEAAPASDTASSGLNGRLQRIAQRLTSLIGLVPSSLGAKTSANSFGVVLASDQAALPTIGYLIDQAASATIQRPADTTQYAAGDLVANSTTAGSVNALQFTTAARTSGGSGLIVSAKIQKSTTSVTSAAFRLHLFTATPTFTSAGDNSAISTVVVASAKGYIGYIDIPAMTAFSDVAWGTGGADNGRAGLPFVASAQIIYGIVEARGTYTPGNAEVFTVSIQVAQN